MKENLIIGGAAIVFVALMAALTAFIKSRPEEIPVLTPKMLAADPDYFIGRKVKIRCDGTETDGQDLIYRTHTHLPPIVRVILKKKADTIPEFAVGICVGKVGPEAVVDCR